MSRSRGDDDNRRFIRDELDRGLVQANNSNDRDFNVWTYEPNAREEAVLDDCARKSFYRFIPTSLILGAGTYYAVKRGMLKPNQRFGAAPKVMLSTIASYFLCQASVSGECARKLKELDNSPLGDHMRSMER